MSRRRSALAALTLTVLACAAAAPAQAATAFWTSPTGAGGACTIVAPCALSFALGSAGNGDEVNLLTPGGATVYNLSAATYTVGGGVTLKPAPGADRPVLSFSGNGKLDVIGTGALIRDVSIRQSAAIYPPLRIASRGTALRVDVIANASQGRGVEFYDGLLRDSLIIAGAVAGTNAVGIFQEPNGSYTDGVLLNDTVIARGTGARAMYLGNIGMNPNVGGTTDLVRNVVTATPDDPTGSGLQVVREATPVSIDVDHSSIQRITRTGTGGDGATVVDGGHNVGPAVFVNAATSDFRQASGSPTLEAGTATFPAAPGFPSLALGSAALDGAARLMGAFPDIGAYETALAPMSGWSAAATGRTTATVGASVTPSGATSAYVEWGTTTAYGQTTAVQALGSGTSAVPVSAALTGLSEGTTYHARVVATAPAGTTRSPDLTFTTEATPPAGAAPAPTPNPGTASTLKLSTTASSTLRVRRGRAAVVCRASGGSGAVTCRGTLTVRSGKSTVRIGTALVRTLKNGSTTLSFRLNRRGAQLLARHGKIAATLTLTGQAGGKRATLTRKVTLRR